MGENSTQSAEYESDMADSIKAMQFAWLSHQKVKRLASQYIKKLSCPGI